MTRARILADFGGVTSSATELNLLDGQTDLASQAELNAKEEYNDDVIQTNIALLAFKTAVNGSLAKYDLQDQIVDEYTDATGVNTGDSTNETLSSGAYQGGSGGGGATGGVQSAGYEYTGYTGHKFITGGNFVLTAPLTVDVILVAGGGGGSSVYNEYGGAGGGAGGVYVLTSLSLSAGTYAIVVGDGGAETNGGLYSGDKGEDSTFKLASNPGGYNLTAKGGGGGTGQIAVASRNLSPTINTGGSGGGHSRAWPTHPNGAAAIDGASNGWASGTNFNNSGNASALSDAYCGGGGGAGAASSNSGGDAGRTGGAGSNAFLTDVSNTAALLTAVSAGVSGYLAGGGAGGGGGMTEAGTGGSGGGGAGGYGNTDVATRKGLPGTANTGSGGGGMGRMNTNPAISDYNIGGAGGSGVVIIRYADSPPVDLTLQSTDTTAEAAPTKADMVMLIEDAGSGVGTVNTHIKGWVSRYETGGTKTWTQGTLVDEGDWGSDKRILAFHDLTLTGTSGTQMAYKITTHSASAVYDTRIHATSIGWR